MLNNIEIIVNSSMAPQLANTNNNNNNNNCTILLSSFILAAIIIFYYINIIIFYQWHSLQLVIIIGNYSVAAIGAS